MRLTILLSLTFIISVYLNVSAQQQSITGSVTDSETGEPLAGVNVAVSGTTIGTSTDANGRYTLSPPADGSSILFSFIGFNTEKIVYIGQTIVDIKMSKAITALDDVIVIGYGTIKKADLTGAISSVKSEMIENTRPVTVQSILQGTMPGLLVTNNDGSPGSEAMIRIRGIGTVNNNDPIYVVDGMIVDNLDRSFSGNNMGFLNPMDIASIEVLKDASAQAIYGSRGANGVILVTTRKGSEGAPKVTFTSVVSTDIAARTIDLLDADQYKDYKMTANYNGFMRQNPGTVISRDSIPENMNIIVQYNKGYNTNWMKEIMQKNVSQNYDFSMSGGTKDLHYTASAGYLDKKGIILNSGFKRNSFRLNTDYKIVKNLIVGENLGISSYVKTGDWGGSSIIWNAMMASPLLPVYKSDGTADLNDPNYNLNKYDAANTAFTAEITKKKAKYLDLVGNIYAELSFLKNFKLRSSWGFNLYNKDYIYFTPSYYISPESFNILSSLEMSHFKSNSWIWENTLTWARVFNKHSVNAFAGYTSEYTRADYQTLSKKGSPENNPEMQTFDAATTQAQISGNYDEFTMISYLGRVNYSYNSKYLATISLRRDGSSKFAEGYRWGMFPSFSVGWKIDEEKFFRNLNQKVISNFKIRGGWGRIGNSSLPAYYGYASQVGSTLYYRYIFNETSYPGYWLTTIGKPDISWETTEQSNIGLEISLLKNMVSLTADYYVKNTRDMLVQASIVDYAGYEGANRPYSNVGLVQNKGYEIAVNFIKTIKNFKFGLNVNLSTLRNKVLSLGPGEVPIYGKGWIERTDKGNPVGYFFGYVVDGVFQTDEEINSYDLTTSDGKLLRKNIKPGDFRFKDLNNDQHIDGLDQTNIGDPWPSLIFGFNVSLGYKNFELTSFFQGTYGNKILDYQRTIADAWKSNTLEYYYKNAWRGEGTTNSFPIISTQDDNWNYRMSDYYVEDGSYLRMKNLQLSYSISESCCEMVRMSSARIWASATNIFTLTGFHGMDPEVGASNSPTQDAGFDGGCFYPKAREFSLGLSVSF